MRTSLLPLPLVSLTVWFFGDRIHRRFESIQAQFAEISARVQENLSGVRLVRAYASESREVESFREMNQEYLERNQRLIRVWGVFYPLLAFLSGLAALLALYLGGREVVRGRISLGQFVAFTSLATTLAATLGGSGAQIFLRDTQANTTSLVSQAAVGGNAGNGASSQPTISADGGFTAFSSVSTNLGAAGGNPQIYVRALH